MSIPYWAEQPERKDPEDQYNDSKWSTETKIAIAILVVTSGLLFWIVSKQPPKSEKTAIEYMADNYDDDLFASDPSAFDETSYVTPGGGTAAAPRASQESDNTNLRWLLMELKRITRAGRSMDGLRESKNPAQSRRCMDGMQKLQRESRTVLQKGGSISLPPELPSINSVLGKIKACISCGGDARAACDSADRDLALISGSVGN